MFLNYVCLPRYLYPYSDAAKQSQRRIKERRYIYFYVYPKI